MRRVLGGIGLAAIALSLDDVFFGKRDLLSWQHLRPKPSHTPNLTKGPTIRIVEPLEAVTPTRSGGMITPVRVLLSRARPTPTKKSSRPSIKTGTTCSHRRVWRPAEPAGTSH